MTALIPGPRTAHRSNVRLTAILADPRTTPLPNPNRIAWPERPDPPRSIRSAYDRDYVLVLARRCYTGNGTSIQEPPCNLLQTASDIGRNWNYPLTGYGSC